MSQYKFYNDVIHWLITVGFTYLICINASIILTVHTYQYFAARMPRKAKLNYNQTEQLII